MELKQSGSQPSGKGPDDWFTGTVRIDPLFAATEPSRVSAALVTFEPGARSAWHTYAIEQPDDLDINEILFRPTRQEL